MRRIGETIVLRRFRWQVGTGGSRGFAGFVFPHPSYGIWWPARLADAEVVKEGVCDGGSGVKAAGDDLPSASVREFIGGPRVKWVRDHDAPMSR